MKNENVCIPWSNWELVEPVGRGQFGTVYKISSTKFGITEYAAMKTISIPSDPQMIQMDYSYGYDKPSVIAKYKSYLDDVLKEYQLMMKVKGCSGIVRCDDISVSPHEDGIGWDVYIRMEYLTPMLQVISDLNDDNTIIKLGLDISKALESCEKAGILHRDIKPQNVLVNDQGDFKLGDFGVSRTLENGNTYGTKGIGTYEYMAPEIYNGGKYGVQADIYSLGMVMYFLLNNRTLPFLSRGKAPTAQEIAEAREKRFSGKPLPRPSNGSDALVSIILKACDFNPNNRYKNAKEMFEDLDSIRYGVSKDSKIKREEEFQQSISGAEWSDSQETVGKNHSNSTIYFGTDTVSSAVFKSSGEPKSVNKDQYRESKDYNAWSDSQETVGKNYSNNSDFNDSFETVGKHYTNSRTHYDSPSDKSSTVSSHKKAESLNNNSYIQSRIENNHSNISHNSISTSFFDLEKPQGLPIVLADAMSFFASIVLRFFNDVGYLFLIMVFFCGIFSAIYAYSLNRNREFKGLKSVLFVAHILMCIITCSFVVMSVSDIGNPEKSFLPNLIYAVVVTIIYVYTIVRIKLNNSIVAKNGKALYLTLSAPAFTNLNRPESKSLLLIFVFLVFTCVFTIVKWGAPMGLVLGALALIGLGLTVLYHKDIQNGRYSFVLENGIRIPALLLLPISAFSFSTELPNLVFPNNFTVPTLVITVLTIACSIFTLSRLRRNHKSVAKNIDEMVGSKTIHSSFGVGTKVNKKQSAQLHTSKTSDKDTYCVAGFWFSLLSVGIIGLFLSIIGVKRAKKNGTLGIGWAQAGIVIAVIKLSTLLIINVLSINSYVNKNNSNNSIQSESVSSSEELESVAINDTLNYTVSETAIDKRINYIIDGSYYNNLINLGCNLQGWTFASNEQLAELNNISADDFPIYEDKLPQEAGSVFTVMHASNSDASKKVIISFEKLNDTNRVVLTEKQYQQASASSVRTYLEQSGVEEIHIDEITVQIGGEEHPALNVSYQMNGQMFYQQSVFIKCDSYMAIITIHNWGEDNIENIRSMFFKINNLSN